MNNKIVIGIATSVQRSLRLFGIIALLIVLVVESGATAYPTPTDVNIQGSVWRWIPEKIVPAGGPGYCDYYPVYRLNADTGTFRMDTPFNSVSYIEKYWDLPSNGSSLSLTVWGARNINGWCGDPVTVTVSLTDSNNITHQLGSFVPVQLDGGVGQGETKKFNISNFAGQKVKLRIKQTSSGKHCTYGYYRDINIQTFIALGKPVKVTTNGADEPHEHVGEWPSDITDGSLDYQSVSSGIEDGCVAWVNDDYNELMVVTVTINLQGTYNINKIRYNMGNCQRAETWNADIMESPFGRTPTNPGTPHSGVWTEQTGDITASSVTIKFEKTRTAEERDWLFIGEIEVWGTPVEIPPIANAGGPYYGYVNESIQFYGTGTGLIDAHGWDFDGNNITDSTLPNPNHSWSVAGTYYPTLKVKDNDGAWSEPDVCEVHVYERGELTVLIVTNFQRMKDIGYGDASVDALQNKVIVDLKRNNPQGKCALVDLDLIPAIKSDYEIWAGHEGDITRTNYLVQRIDDYIEEQKRIRFPMLKYVIIVGSHEVIPMKARPDDFFDEDVSEKQWAEEKLLQKSGYLYEIYKNGFYLTDTIYADLSYMDSTKDHELTPELAVGRLVETPEQIIKVIDAYMNNNGEIPKKQFLSIAAYDYKDSASKAAEEMRKSGVPTHYVSACNYSSLLVPFAFNTKKPDVTYLSGHGDYNEIETYHEPKDCFMAGEDLTRGDTSEISNLDGAVIISAGCHNGINLGNKLYHEPDAGTNYSDFPEEFAKKGVVAYIGATGYTRITKTNCSNDTNDTGNNEVIATNTIHRLLCGTDIGTAHRDGLMLYYVTACSTSPINHEKRRILAIPTLYGISTYKDPILGNGAISSVIGYNIKRVWGTQQPNPEELSITISNYSIKYSSGIVIIPGTSQVVSSDEPIIPILFVEKTLPRGSNITNVVWNETASDSVTVINDIPIPNIGFGEERIKGNFSYDGFYPPIPFANYSVLTLGGGGSEVGISVTPVQYNSKTNQTKIWTKMVFDIYYNVPDTGISVANLSTDKSKYSPREYVELNASLLNKGSNISVNLSVLLRNLNTSEEITEMDIGLADLGSGIASVTRSICLQSIPLNQIVGKCVQCELLVSNPYNLEILASESVAFNVTSRQMTIYVDDDFEDDPANHRWNTIQEGVNDANDGDTVIVYNGTYYEDNGVNISKDRITMQGEGANTTTIHGRWTAEKVVYVTGNYTKVSGFTVAGSTSDGTGIYVDADHCNISDNILTEGCGISLSSSSECIVHDNIANSIYVGINLYYSSNNTIANNFASSNDWGIVLDSTSNNNTIMNNIANSNYNDGICLYRSSNNNYITGNTADANKEYGIRLWSTSTNNVITENNIRNNREYGINLDYTVDNEIYHNNFINNSKQAYDHHGFNSWDKGLIIGGNYWSDHVCHGNPSNGSEPYTGIDTDAGAVDNYPFEDSNGWVKAGKVFDIGSPANPYPSIPGTHNGTITPSQTIPVKKLYTYPCSGTGGHTEYARIWNSFLDTNATWDGYTGDWHNITFNKSFTLVPNETYNYTILTGSYPQIIHESSKEVTEGVINCTVFVDVNGKKYTDWIPAIRLWS